ncbi:hypothetical protein SDC9_50164 [bioreactor metagenome]|uniref:Uncharacterized protein n=1 Tax=bioreactor metagenome TaxID=1076179 RepID=A0A644WJY6_9ZZZZ
MKVDFDELDKKVLELSFINKHQRNTAELNNTIEQLQLLRDNYFNEYGLPEEIYKLQEIILNLKMFYKEAIGEDYIEEYKSLEQLMYNTKY